MKSPFFEYSSTRMECGKPVRQLRSLGTSASSQSVKRGHTSRVRISEDSEVVRGPMLVLSFGSDFPQHEAPNGATGDREWWVTGQ